MSLYENKDGGGQYPQDDEEMYIDMDTVRRLSTEDTEAPESFKMCKYGFCRQKWSVLGTVAFLGFLCLLWIILMSTVCTIYQAILGHLEEMKQSNRETNMKLSQTNESVVRAQEQLLAKIKEINNLVRAECPPGWRSIGLQCYYVSVVTKPWQEAEKYCTEQQSNLLIVENKVEMDALQLLIVGWPFWIGLKLSFTSWKWVDGSDLTFSNWSPGEPNNLRQMEQCAEMKSDGWNDVDCRMMNKFICKRK